MEYIFVYGVFRDIFCSMLGESSYIGGAFIHGDLYKVNDFYPGFIPSNTDCKVHGDIYLIYPNKLNKLDEFEGEEYTRRKVWTSLGIEAWVYEYKYDTSKFEKIKSGDWLLR